jgi:hypothetical protein
VIAGLQSDVLIANLQAKVKSLHAQLLGAQTPSTVTESLAPETSDQMTKIESNMALMTTQFTNWRSEMQHLQQSEQHQGQGTKHSQSEYIEQFHSSPQSKRIDTSQTPDRNDPMYTQPTKEEQIVPFLERRAAHRRDLDPPTPPLSP